VPVTCGFFKDRYTAHDHELFPENFLKVFKTSKFIFKFFFVSDFLCKFSPDFPKKFSGIFPEYHRPQTPFIYPNRGHYSRFPAEQRRLSSPFKTGQ